MPAIRLSVHRFAALCASLLWFFGVPSATAQNIPGIDPNIQATLVAAGPATAGEDVALAIRFEPVSDAWHGYWKNPGDAGYGMQLEWELPQGWRVGEPQYPVPGRLLIGDLMNHIYEGEYAVLVPLSVPADAPDRGLMQIAVEAQWLACTDEICVPEQGRLELALPLGDGNFGDSRFARWRAAVPPMLDSTARFAVAGDSLDIAVPLPAALQLSKPHVFVATPDLVQYAAVQTFTRDGDMLIARIPLADPDARPQDIEAILAFDDSEGVRFRAVKGAVPDLGSAFVTPSDETPGLGLLLLAALAGGLILNIMPCVFPILSLKALSLVRAGNSEAEARKEGLAYSAGVVLACVALGAIMLALRAAGEQVGWAFQLQEPAVVAVLFVLAGLITANFAGLFTLPSVSLTRDGEPVSAFATGLLAAIAATPCTGPFMAAAIGAALLLPAGAALLLFAVLGLGLALPFLLIGYVPAARRMLPRPGPWMETFRKLLAIPMGLTAIALAWLLWRLGGWDLLLLAAITMSAVAALFVIGHRRQLPVAIWIIGFAGIVGAGAFLASSFAVQHRANQASSILDPGVFSAAALAEARAEGRTSGQPVFVWFTADWCVTCKVNEQVAIEREAVRKAFADAGVITLRGDWTRRDPAISEYLTQQRAAGVPLYVWYPPGGDARQLPQILTPGSLIALAENAAAPAAGTDRSTAPDAGSN